jgi:hypothetical protein
LVRSLASCLPALGTCISTSTLHAYEIYTQARKHHGGGNGGGGVSSLKKETAVELIVLRAYTLNFWWAVQAESIITLKLHATPCQPLLLLPRNETRGELSLGVWLFLSLRAPFTAASRRFGKASVFQ